MAHLTRKGGKDFHPRHATQAAASANRQERAVEKQERQASKAEIRRELRAYARAAKAMRAAIDRGEC